MRKKRKNVPMSSRDKAFLEQFYQENRRFIFFIAGKYTVINDEQEDLVQDTMERLLCNISTLRELSEPKAKKYIALTVKAVYLDGEKKKRASGITELDDSALESLARAGLVPWTDTHNNSANLAVEQLRKELDHRDWFVLEGKYILGYSQEELGRQLGVAPDSVRMIICRAKEKARKILHPEFTVEDNSDE